MLNFVPPIVEIEPESSAPERRVDFLLKQAIADRKRYERMASSMRRTIAKIRKNARDFDIPVHR